MIDLFGYGAQPPTPLIGASRRILRAEATRLVMEGAGVA